MWKVLFSQNNVTQFLLILKITKWKYLQNWNRFSISGQLDNYTIQIIDSNGSVYQTLTTVGNSLSIDISNLPAGLYLVSVTNIYNSNLELKIIIKQ